MSALLSKQSPTSALFCFRIDEEDYGGHGSLLSEGLAPSMSLFLVRGMLTLLVIKYRPDNNCSPYMRIATRGKSALQALEFVCPLDCHVQMQCCPQPLHICHCPGHFMLIPCCCSLGRVLLAYLAACIFDMCALHKFLDIICSNQLCVLQLTWITTYTMLRA